MGKPHAHPSFALIGDKWYMVLHGEVVALRPVELRQAHGTRECVHCGQLASGYCHSCRRAVCWEGDCFPQHALDHSEWREKRVGWTPVKL